MAKREEFMVMVGDRATGDFAVTGPTLDDSKLTEKVAKAKEAGRDLGMSSAPISREQAIREAKERFKGNQVPMNQILP